MKSWKRALHPPRDLPVRWWMMALGVTIWAALMLIGCIDPARFRPDRCAENPITPGCQRW